MTRLPHETDAVQHRALACLRHSGTCCVSRVACVFRQGKRAAFTYAVRFIIKNRPCFPANRAFAAWLDGIGMGRITHALRDPTPRTQEFGRG